MMAVILAAGKGTRLLPYSRIMPKALMPIEAAADGRLVSIIEKLVSQIKNAGISKIAIVVNYRADMIKDYFDELKLPGCELHFVTQEVLDGNAGAYYRCAHLVGGDDVLITDCDNYVPDEQFIAKMREQHEKGGNDLTVAVSRVDNIAKFAIIRLGADGTPEDIYEKPTDRDSWGNLAKSGVMMLSSRLASQDKDISLATSGEYTTTQIIKHCLDTPGKYKVSLFDIPGGFNDIGTWPEFITVFRRNMGRESR